MVLRVDHEGANVAVGLAMDVSFGAVNNVVVQSSVSSVAMQMR